MNTSDMDPNFEDWDSEYEDDPGCEFGGDACEIMCAQEEINKARKHLVLFHLKRIFSRSFREWLELVYATIGLSVLDYCQSDCPLRACWQDIQPEPEANEKEEAGGH